MKTLSAKEPESSILKSLLAETFLYFFLFFSVYFFVLQFIFPGLIDPLWPHHSDLYIPLALTSSYTTPIDVLKLPRPIGFVFLWAIGHIGIQGVIASLITVMALNFSIISAIFRRSMGLKINATTLLSVSIFAYLMTSHPFQYEFSTLDATAAFSLLLLLLAFLALLYWKNCYAFFILSLLAFLTKETYGLSAIFLCACLVLSPQKRKLGIIATAALICSLGLALIVGHFLSSPFTTNSNAYGEIYAINIYPESVLRELAIYITIGLNPISTFIISASILTSAAIFGVRSKECLVVSATIIAGALALIPNSVLPNHHIDGYSFSAAYLLFCPVIALAKSSEHGKKLGAASLLFFAIALTSPIFSKTQYIRQQWIAEEESRQKLILENIEKSLFDLSGKAVLVSGLNIPYNIFGQPAAIKALLPAEGEDIKFYVVRYDKIVKVKLNEDMNRASANVIFITPIEINNFTYSDRWLFRSNGSQIHSLSIQDNVSEAASLSNLDWLKYPELHDVFSSKAPHQLDGYDYLKCGTTLIYYNAYSTAQPCLEKARLLISENPYPHYFLGLSLENQGNSDAARQSYRQAVKLGSSDNPAFQEALNRLQ